MPKVYIANKSPHDYRPALKYGELVFITEGDVNKFDISGMYRVFNAALADATEDDFFIPTALPMMCGIATGILVQKFGIVHFLLFRAGKYIERTIDFTDGEIYEQY